MSNDQEKNLTTLGTMTLASLLLGVAFVSWWLYTGAGFFEDEMSHSWSFGPRKAPHVPLPANTVPWMQVALATAPPTNLREGAAVYADFCQFCHGADGKGNTPVGLEYDPRPPDLNTTLPTLTPAALTTAIRDGMATPEVNTEPRVGPRWHAFSLYLSPAQLADVTAYVNSIFGARNAAGTKAEAGREMASGEDAARTRSGAGHAPREHLSPSEDEVQKAFIDRLNEGSHENP